MPNEELIQRELNFKKDYDQLVELYDEVFKNELSSMGTSATQVLKEIKAILPLMKIFGIFSKKYRHMMDGYVYTHENKIIAATTVSTWNMKDWEIAMVATDPEYRRKGLGRALVNKSIEHAKKYKAEMCYLEVLQDNKPAYDLYSNLGFVQYDSVAKYLLDFKNLPEERQNEKLPEEYSLKKLKRSKKTSKERYELEIRSKPELSEQFMPTDEGQFKNTLVKKILRPILGKIMGLKFNMDLIYFNDQLVASLFVNIKQKKEDIIGVNLVIDKSHEEKLAKPLIDYAIKQIIEAESPCYKSLITISTASKTLTEVVEKYNFKQIELNHYLGLKL
ncbi:MAG: GNAT family N-acetyltransferase [Candidatus Kariarchaeaceae archaeon]